VKTNVTTEKHFATFQNECFRLWKLWNVSGWRLEVRHGECEESTGGLAAAASYPTQRMTRIFPPKEWPSHTQVTNSELLYTARHETIHALLGPLSTAAQSRFVTDSELCGAEHEVLHTLDRALP